MECQELTKTESKSILNKIYMLVITGFFLSGSYLVKKEWTLSIVSVEVGKKKLAFDRRDDIILHGQICWALHSLRFYYFCPYYALTEQLSIYVYFTQNEDKIVKIE